MSIREFLTATTMVAPLSIIWTSSIVCFNSGVGGLRGGGGRGGGGNRPPPREIQIINLKNCIIWSILATQQKWTISVLTYVPIWGGGGGHFGPSEGTPQENPGDVSGLRTVVSCGIHTVNRLSSAAAATAS